MRDANTAAWKGNSRQAYGLYVERAIYILFRYIRLDFMQTPYALVHAIYTI